MLNLGELGLRSATATTLAAFTGRLAPVLLMVRVMGVAIARAINSYPLTALATPRYSGAFSQ